jgi:predicted dehydrogenase
MKVGIVGAGNWGSNLVKTFDELGALRAVVDTNASMIEQCRYLYPYAMVGDDYETMLADNEVAAVVIATPAQTHYGLARAALLAGKDVFVEKPFTQSFIQAEELVSLAEKNGRILMVGYLLLYQPAIKWIKQCLESGAIGTVRILHQERLKLGRVRSVENVLWNFGVHDIAVLLYLAGEQPQKITVKGQQIIQPQIADNVYLHMEFENNLHVHLHVSWLWPEQRRSLIVVGTQAMLTYDELEQTVTLHRKGIASGLANVDQGSEIVFKGSSKPLSLECQHFLEAIAGRNTPRSDGRSALAVIRILEEASSELN